jgi:hypothetical protein
MKLGTLVSALSAFPSEANRRHPGPRNPEPRPAEPVRRHHWWRAR